MSNGCIVSLLSVIIFTASLSFADESRLVDTETSTTRETTTDFSLGSRQEDLPDSAGAFESSTEGNQDVSTGTVAVLDTGEPWKTLRRFANVTREDENPLVPGRVVEDDTNQNITDESSSVSKRYVTNSMSPELPVTESTYAGAAEPDSSLLTLEQLKNLSCELETSKFAHDRMPGMMLLEIFCEIEKLVHYMVIAVRNFKSDCELGSKSLLDIENLGENVISLKNLLSDSALVETIECGIARFQMFFNSLESLSSNFPKILFGIIEKYVPVSGDIRETWDRLKIAVENLFIRIEGLFEYFEPGHHPVVDILTKLREEIVTAKEEAMNLLSGYLSDCFEGKTAPLSVKTTSLVESLLQKSSVRESVHRFLIVVKKLVDTFLESFLSDVQKSPTTIHLPNLPLCSTPTCIWQNMHRLPSSSDRSFSTPCGINSVDTQQTETPTEEPTIGHSGIFTNQGPLDVLLSAATPSFLGEDEPPGRSSGSSPVSILSTTFTRSPISIRYLSTLENNAPNSVGFTARNPITSPISTADDSVSTASTMGVPSDVFTSHSSESEPVPSNTTTYNTVPIDDVTAVTYSTMAMATQPPSRVPVSSLLPETTSQTDSTTDPSAQSSSVSSTTDAASSSSSSSSSFTPFVSIPYPTSTVQDSIIPYLLPIPDFLPRRTDFNTDASTNSPGSDYSSRFTKTNPSPRSQHIIGSLYPSRYTETSLVSPAIPNGAEKEALNRKNVAGNVNPFGYFSPTRTTSWSSQQSQPDHRSLYETYLKFVSKNLYSYPRYDNFALIPASNGFQETLDSRKLNIVPSSVPSFARNSGLCGTSAFLPSLSNFNDVLNNNGASLQLPANEIARAINDGPLSPGDIIVIFPRVGNGLIGHVFNRLAPINFNAYDIGPVIAAIKGAHKAVTIWHIRSRDFNKPACQQLLRLL